MITVIFTGYDESYGPYDENVPSRTLSEFIRDKACLYYL